MKQILTFFFAAVCLTMFTACSSSDDDVDVYGSIYGVISDASTGECLYNATITLEGVARSTTSGSDGYFQFDNLKQDQYTVLVQKEGYQKNTKHVNVLPGERIKLEFPLIRINK